MKSQILALTLIAVAFGSNVSFAKDHNKGKGKKAAVAGTAEVYKLDTQASSVEWKGSKATGDSHNGVIALKDGQLEVAGKDIKGGQFAVKMDSLINKDLEKSPDYKTKLETHLKSEDFFNVAKHPESTFKIKSVSKKSDTEISVKGDLTMIGKTQEVEFPATVKWEGNKVVGTANLKIDRTKWDLQYGSGKFFKNLGDKLINDDIELKLNLVATK
jgi:polyisoprenoid-binding protein YceI